MDRPITASWRLTSPTNVRQRIRSGLPPGRSGCPPPTGAAYGCDLIADGVGQQTPLGPVFRRVPPPTRVQLERLLATLTCRIARHLVRRGWLREDAEGGALTGEDLGDSALGTLRAHSIPYRMAVGPNAGRKALTLRTLLGREADCDLRFPCVAGEPARNSWSSF
jgi:hypothetical protein